MYKPIKELGQNFLSDVAIVRPMIDALNIKSGDLIIEIGPGHGILTEDLSSRISDTGSKLIAVEFDERFYQKLRSMFSHEKNVSIVHEDILKWLPSFDPQQDFKIIGSLPYYITSPIIHSIIKAKTMPPTCVLLIQKEVAQKICAQVPDSSYMSSFVQTFYNVEYLFEIPRTKFEPVPQVDGAVIRLIKKDPSEVSISSDLITKYEGFLHKGYSNPRKMLNKVFSKEELGSLNIDPSLRPQNLDFSDWSELFKKIYEL